MSASCVMQNPIPNVASNFQATVAVTTCHMTVTGPLHHFCRDYPLLLLTEFMNKGDLLGVLQDSRPHMPLPLQMRFAAEVADGMAYLSTDM